MTSLTEIHLLNNNNLWIRISYDTSHQAHLTKTQQQQQQQQQHRGVDPGGQSPPPPPMKILGGGGKHFDNLKNS